jgi:O-antigen ligase
VGLLTATLSLTAKRWKEYWIAVFALVLPLDIKKMLIGSSYVRELTEIYGIPIGEIPGPVIYLSDLPLLVLISVWLYEILIKKQGVFFPKSNVYALAFIAWSGLSLINATVFSYGFFDLLRTIKFYLLYLYIANNTKSISTLKTLVKYLLLGVIFQGLICIYQYSSQDISHIFGNLFGKQDLYTQESIEKFSEFFAVAPGSEKKRASGTVGPTNAQAQYFEFLLPLAFLLSLASLKFWRHAFYWAALIIGLIGLIVTYSRGGMLGIMVGFLAVFLFAKRLKLLTTKKYAAVIIVSLLIGVLLTPAVYKFSISRKEAGLARIHLYKVGVDMIRTHPILGVGLNNHIVRESQFDPDTYDFDFPTPIHNHYLFIASEVGIPGLIFFLAFLLSSLLMSLTATRSKDFYCAVIALGIIGAFMAIGVHNLVDHLSFHTNLTLLWLFAGLAAALYRLKPSQYNNTEKLIG